MKLHVVLIATAAMLCASTAWGQSSTGGSSYFGGVGGLTSHTYPSSGVSPCAWSIAAPPCKASPVTAKPTKIRKASGVTR